MQTTQVKSLVAKSLILVWSILCIAVFIYYPGRVSVLYGSCLNDLPSLASKLGRIEPLNYIANILWAFIGVIIFSAVCISVGGFLLQLLKYLPDESTPSRPAQFAFLATAFSIGQGLLSIIFLTLAGFHQLTPLYVILVLAIGFGVGIRPISRFIAKSKIRKILNPFDKSDNKVYRTIIWLTIGILALSLTYSTARLSYDSVALYFSAAKITAMTHHIQFFSNDSFIVSFFQTGIQYAALIQVFGDQAARMYSWINGVIILIFAIAIGQKAGLSKHANLILLTLILTSTAFVDLMGDGKIDLASTVPAIAAIYCMEINKSNLSKATLLLTGFFAGLAMVARPYNIFLIALVIALFYLQHAYQQRKENVKWIYNLFARPILLISVGVVCLLTYHLIANWIILGDPLAFIKNYQNVNSSDWQWALDPHQIWIFRLLYPLVITFLNTPQSLGNITPLFVAFLPILLVTGLRRKPQTSRDLIVLIYAALITLLAWVILLFTVFEIRYILFLWIILFIPLALTIEKIIDTGDPFFQITTKLLLIVLPVFIAFRIIYISLDTYSPIDSQGNPQCYDFPFCQFLKPVNEMANIGDRVLTLNAYRYYLRSDLFACSTTSEEYSTLQNLSKEDSTAFWTEVYREGYKFITYESNYSVRHLNIDLIPNPSDTPPWLSLKPIYGQPGDAEVAYRIQARNPPVEIEFNCQNTLSGAWQVKRIAK